MNKPTYQHRDLAAGRWLELSLIEQMANIGSEVLRTISWKNKNIYNPQEAFFRALELLELSKNDRKHSSSTRREICRVYECLVDWFDGSHTYHTTDKEWSEYFMAFTYAARKGR